MTTPDKTQPPADSLVAEWVGLHYGLHWESLSARRKAEFRERYAEAHAEEPPRAAAATQAKKMR
jgi:hypothetical protein